MDFFGKGVLWKLIFSLFSICLNLKLILGLGFTVEPSSLLVLPNARAVFKCSADNPEAEVQWMRDGQFIKNNPTQGVQILENKLIVRSLTSHAAVLNTLHSATFQCVITYKGLSLLSQQAKLIVAELKPFPIQEDRYVQVPEGNAAVIPCEPPHSVPVAITEFEFNNHSVISKSENHFFLLPSGNLHITKVSKLDEGTYRCIVNNPFLGYKIKAYHKIHLKVITPSITQQIYFTHRPQKSVGVVTGSNVTIECAAAGYPVPKINWLKRKGSLPKKRHQQIAGNLMILNVQTEDAGSYSCVATNDVSRGVSAVVTLQINELPEVINPTETISVRENTEVTLKCSVTGNPKPVITWIYNGMLLKRRSSVSIRYNSLTLHEATPAEAGAYQCFAINDLGSSYASTFVEIGSKTIEIDVSSSDKESKKTSNNKNNNNKRKKKDKKNRRRKKGRGKKNRKKNRKDTNVDEENIESTDKMVPPTRPHITKLTDHSVMVRWDVPENDGLKIQFYKLQYKDVGGGYELDSSSDWKTVTAIIEPHIKSYEVLDLETGHSYRFRIAAVYSNHHYKLGPNSFKFLLEKDPPMKKPVIGPKIVSAEIISPSAIVINWEYKQNVDEVEVDGFFVYYRSAHTAGGYSKITVLGFNTRSHIIDHLLPKVAYEIKMQSFNMAGTSDFSNFYVANPKNVTQWKDKHSHLQNLPDTEKELGETDSLDVGHRNVKMSSNTHKSSQLLYTVLGVALSIMLVVLFVFIIACSIKQRNERLPNELGHAIHSKYQDTSAHIHESHHLNGGLLTRSSPLVKNHIPGIQNGYISQDSSNKINISVNPLSYDANENDGDKTPQLDMIPINNNEEMVYSRLLQNSDNHEADSPCNEPSECQPMLASEENSQIQSPDHSIYDGRIPISNDASVQRFSKSSHSNLDTDEECSSISP